MDTIDKYSWLGEVASGRWEEEKAYAMVCNLARVTKLQEKIGPIFALRLIVRSADQANPFLK